MQALAAAYAVINFLLGACILVWMVCSAADSKDPNAYHWYWYREIERISLADVAIWTLIFFLTPGFWVPICLGSIICTLVVGLGHGFGRLDKMTVWRRKT